MEIPMLHERQRKILRYLNEFGDCMTGSDLSQRLQISSRTIRSDIAEINRCIPPEIAQIQASRGSGYRLVIHNRDEFHRYISTGLNLLTREDRSRHLLIALLWATEPLNLEQLEDEMFVSLLHDLQQQAQHLRVGFLDLIKQHKWIFHAGIFKIVLIFASIFVGGFLHLLEQPVYRCHRLSKSVTCSHALHRLLHHGANATL